MPKTIFLGLMYPANMESELLLRSKVGLQASINAYQWAFVRGYAEATGEEIHVISSIPVGAFPRKNKTLFYPSFEYRECGIHLDSIGFLNFYFMRDWIRKKRVNQRLKRMLDTGQVLQIFVYDLYLPWLQVLSSLKRRYGARIKICAIVADLPGKYGASINWQTIASRYHSMTAQRRMALQTCADCYVLLTKFMKEPLHVGKKPYVVVEGFFTQAQTEALSENPHVEHKVVLYTGSLNPAFGIDTLLSAFTVIEDPLYRLWICGPQSDAKTVASYAHNDPRIEYKGYLGRNDIIKLQSQCTIQINPRSNAGLYTKYSFPSKTMEYLYSGKPTLMYRLDGIPDEYYDYLFTIEGEGAEVMRHAIIELCEMDPLLRNERALAGKQWLKREKNAPTQVRKVIAMLQSGFDDADS